MGRGGGRGQKRTLKRDFREHRQDQWVTDKRPRSETWEEMPTSNDDFVEYYKTQRICPDEEWDAFMATLARPLPLTFRINGSGKFADELRRTLEADFMSGFAEGPVEVDGETVAPPLALPWYPGKLAWQMDFSRTQLRKLPALKALHEFMKRETDVGAITRQEAVSMVPPLFLDVLPCHRVLDMCAAPGSKTAQLLEALHAAAPEPGGVVVANDADVQRCNMLTHQTQRIRSPALVVTNHEAQAFPLVPDLDPASPDTHILYDRILCDVPCSGDGTLRKQPDIWRRWTPAHGNGLHILQLRITLRACELLRVGGRMVYSTCTFNPVEDEAVVAEVLRRTRGAMQLVDVSGEVPRLRRCAGQRTWRVKDRDGWYGSWEEGKGGYKLDPSMFPDAASDALPLDRCMRFLPHHQDTGGFFVAVLRKVAALEGLEYPTVEHRQGDTRGAKRAKQAKQGAAALDASAGSAPGGAEGAALAAEAGEGGEDAAGGAEGAAVREAGEAATAAGDVGPAEAAAAAAAAAAAGGAGPTTGAADAASGEGRSAQPARRKQQVVKGLPEWGIRGGGARNRGGAAAAGADKGGGGRWHGIDPIVPFAGNQHVESIRTFYGLGPGCPVPDALIARSEDGRPKKLAYVSSGARLLLRTDAREQLKVTAAGLKVFERQENKDNLLSCSYRVAQEGLPSLLPHITRQRFQPTVEEFLALILDRAVALPDDVKVHMTKKVAKDSRAAAGGAGAEAEAAANGHSAAADDAGEAAEDGMAAAAAAAGAEPGAVAQAATDGAERTAEGAEEAAGAAAGSVAEAPAAVDGAPPAAAPAGEAEAEPKAPGFPKPRRAITDASSLQQLAAVDYGCCVATLRDGDAAALGLAPNSAAAGGLAANAPLAVSCWRGRGSVNVLVSKQECAQMAERLQAAVAGGAAAAR